ncbi:uncharacterized protein N7469_004592 [Penicillium citrinum]|uniref:Uncharacterized protein n=1 Tax=Penicillium citrinum TaxID=5077 RepID=A0A9W9P4U9_PENCI|nr:uncharacterized protein N7469_004592 [Penicillium citrinum]KAJ5235424.1 hypothetical protein N7469_004592 [Penicillium citrinum]
MGEQLPPFGNQKRASWRSSCRNRLSQHIWETLGVKVQPSDVRLKPEEDMHYRWQIEDPSLEPLFQKHLSKHSVGAYMLLQRGVGQKFFAVRPEKDLNKEADLDLMAQLRAENLSLTEKLRLSEEKAHRKEQEAIEAEDEIRSQNSVIREAQMTIHLHQQDILNWMALCEWALP